MCIDINKYIYIQHLLACYKTKKKSAHADPLQIPFKNNVLIKIFKNIYGLYKKKRNKAVTYLKLQRRTTKTTTVISTGHICVADISI